ncbi:hypothetical protein GMD78_13525 [Ornithinibacillus sp. L9]|uniref:Uncharacterized protein n=1 Tax=Ornithinibacillus caprae TaxID=2678566 RepID=A0A6N8FIY3_9BACI|nr:hypothetical protein [Ornithinibacillus caprae]MUK89383.1 hypothetical protein [Ornithinibacillus caprae]
MKEKVLWVGILLVLISNIGNYIFFQSKQLEEPIFLDHYITKEIYDEQHEVQLTFYYLTNKKDPDTVSYAEVNEVMLHPENNAWMWFDNHQQPRVHYEQEYSHYYLMAATFRVPVDMLSLEAGDSWSFENINVYFSNGQQVADIGKVKITKLNRANEGFDFRMSGSSHRGVNVITAREKLNIVDIQLPFAEEISNDIAMKVDSDNEQIKEEFDYHQTRSDSAGDDLQIAWKDVPGIELTQDVFPITLEKDGWIKISTKLSDNRISFFDFSMSVIGETESGEEIIGQSHILDHPYLESEDVQELINKKGGGTK